MGFQVFDINIAASKEAKASVLVIYTGGTFGMVYDDKHTLVPFNFTEILENIPVLSKLDLKLTVYSSEIPIDSANIDPNDWETIGGVIAANYEDFDGFVVLHGTDTMAYSASALSFMLQGLNKPVIFTGAQIPVGALRSDARENFITALEIASAKHDNQPVVNEVCIYFNEVLLRGNRAVKVRSSEFGAFESENYPILAKAGIAIDYNLDALMPHYNGDQLNYTRGFDTNVTLLKLYPGISPNVLSTILSIPSLKGLVLETYGSGNAITADWFLAQLGDAIENGLIVINVSQCLGGKVDQNKYQTGKMLQDLGVISGREITTEAALTKLMFLLARGVEREKFKQVFKKPLAGELH